MKRIDDHRFVALGARIAGLSVEPHQKMTREANSQGVYPEAARDLDVNDGQRDRDTGLPVQDVVEKRITRVVVVVSGAVEAAHDIKVVGKQARLHRRGHARQPVLGERSGQLIETRALRDEVEPRVGVPRNEEGSGQQVEPVVARACVVAKLHPEIIPRL